MKAVTPRRTALVLVLLATLTCDVSAGRVLVGAPSAQRSKVVVNEVQYDPPVSGSEQSYEWLELLNVGADGVALGGWQIADNQSAAVLPDLELAPGEFLIVAAGDGFDQLFPEFAGRVVRLGGRIGNGLGNGGDQVRLLDAEGRLVDGMSYGDDTTVLDPSVRRVAAGHSLERLPAGADTDSAADWIDQPSPSPGAPASVEPPRPTSPLPAPTPAESGAVLLNEVLPAPREIDWDGDGTASATDEWIELYSLADVDLDLRGWQLDDIADGGSPPFVIPEGTILRSRGHLLFFRRDTKIALNNDADSVRLLRPDASLADEMSYERTGADASYSRFPDGIGPWTDTLAPSPGGPNVVTHPTPNPAGPTPLPSATPGEGRPTPYGPSPTTSPGRPTGPAPAYLPFLVTEVLFDPLPRGEDAAFEWVEIFNRTDAPISTGGWSLGDALAWDPLGDMVVPPRGYLVIVASADAGQQLAQDGALVWVVSDGRIGNGLGNKGDLVRVRGPTGEVVDAVSYGANLQAFDPAVPLVPPGSSIERIPSDRDTDSAADWWPQPEPSPGRAGAHHEAPPDVVINELLPAPRDIDWDGSGEAAFTDEWIELYNRSPHRVRLGRWRLTVGDPERWSYPLPDDLVIAAGAYLVVPRRESGLSLGNRNDRAHLVRDDGMRVDSVAWEDGPGYDRSLCRLPDGGPWQEQCLPTPGQANRPLPSPVPAATSSTPVPEAVSTSPPADYRDLTLAAVRALPDGEAVALRGSVLLPAGLFGRRTMYVADATAGLRLFLAPRTEELPRLPIGAAVAARGTLGTYRGERQLVLSTASEVWLEDRPASPVVAVAVRSGAIGEEHEGRLVRVRGRISRVTGGSFWLDDGSGECQVRIDRRSGVRWPRPRVGERWHVQGVVSQYAARRPWHGGYRILPRLIADVQMEPSPADSSRVADRAPGALKRAADNPGRTVGGRQEKVLGGDWLRLGLHRPPFPL